MLFIALYSGCSGSGTLQSGYTIPADKLVGSWRTDYNLNSKRGILTFRADSTYTDSVFTITSDSLKLIPDLIVKGRYYVEGPFIKIKNASVLYPDFQQPGSVKSWHAYIDNLAGYFSGETLYLQPVIEFTSGALTQRSPSGEWITERWICTYNENLRPQVKNGIVKETYDFDTVSMKCRISKECLFENSPPAKGTAVDFTYRNRELTLGGTDKKWIVFYQNNTYWFNQNYYRYNRNEPGRHQK